MTINRFDKSAHIELYGMYCNAIEKIAKRERSR